MEQLELKVEPRQQTGSSAMRRLRKEGEIPAVVYSDGEEAKYMKLNAHEFKVMISRCSATQLFRFQSSDKGLNGLLTLIKSVQMEPIKEDVMHVDFLAVRADRKISMTVPLELVGESPAVKAAGATINQTVYEIDIECLPSGIPDALRLDISALEVGKSLRVSDLQTPAGVTLKIASDKVLASAHIEKLVIETPAPAAEVAEAAPVEGEAVEAKEGTPKEKEKEKDKGKDTAQD